MGKGGMGTGCGIDLFLGTTNLLFEHVLGVLIQVGAALADVLLQLGDVGFLA